MAAYRLTTDIGELESIARRTRSDVIRMIHHARSGNPGSVLSSVDILVALYHSLMKTDPADPAWGGRDLLCLSKGQACPAQYSLLANMGFFPVEELYGYRRFNSICQTHPEYAKPPGMDFTSGSLGQGLSAAVGMALALKRDKLKNRVFVLLGDGETQEGQVWEAAMSASHFALDAITVVVDANGLQGDGRVADIMGSEPMEERWRSFGWDAVTVDGHNFGKLVEVLGAPGNGRPRVVVARTVKGKGVSFMEGSSEWHVVNNMTDDDLAAALKELEHR